MLYQIFCASVGAGFWAQILRNQFWGLLFNIVGSQARDEAEELEGALTELITLPLLRILLARCIPR